MSDMKSRWKALRTSVTTRRFFFSAMGVISLISAWYVVSLFVHSIVIASPQDTLFSLIRMIRTERFWVHFFISIRRIVSGIILGGFAGFVLGLFAGLNEDIKHFLEPLRWTLTSVPAVVMVVMAMLWFGMGSTMVIFITALLLSPIVYVNTVKGLEMVDDSSIEMARVYNFSLGLKLRHVYIPAITAPLVSALILLVGMGIRIVILAEIMGAAEGIGYAISMNRSNLEIPALCAWIVVCIAIVGFIECLILRPLEHYVLRWKE